MPAPKKLFIVDERMLKLIYYIESVSLKGIKTKKEICDRIGIVYTGIYEIKSGKRKFTTQQVLNACTYFEVDVNWIFGLTESMFSNKKSNPIDFLKEAVMAIEFAYGPEVKTGKGFKEKSTTDKIASTTKEKTKSYK